LGLLSSSLADALVGKTPPEGFSLDGPLPISFLLTASFPINLFGIAGITTVAWLLATFVTRPTPTVTLDAFYQKIRPGGPGWKPSQARHPQVTPDAGLGRLALYWLMGSATVYLALFGTGYLVLGEGLRAAFALGGGAALLAGLLTDMRRQRGVIRDA
jgi:hypothetical protein